MNRRPAPARSPAARPDPPGREPAPLLRGKALPELADDAIAAEEVYVRAYARHPESPEVGLADDRRRAIAARIWRRLGATPRLLRRGRWALDCGWSAEAGRAIVVILPLYDLDAGPVEPEAGGG